MVYTRFRSSSLFRPGSSRRSSAFEFSLWTPDFDSESAAGPVRSSAAH